MNTSSTTSAPLVEVTRSGNCATVTLNRPSTLNALTVEGLAELGGVLRDLDDDRAVRAVVLTGYGRVFSAGGDMSALSVGEVTSDFVRAAVRVAETLFSMRPVTIAAVNGACAGGGMALACASDFRIASESAFFKAAYLAIGTPGDLGLSWFLSHTVGLARAKELCLLDERISSSRAADMGLVSRVVPDGELSRAAQELAASLSARAPLALAAMKQNLNAAVTLDLPGFLDRESDAFARNSGTQDAAEAVRAFVEKRSPRFRGA